MVGLEGFGECIGGLPSIDGGGLGAVLLGGDGYGDTSFGHIDPTDTINGGDPDGP